MSDERHITLPAGFVAGAVHCGLKQAKSEDMAIIAAEAGAVAAAVVTTRNQVVGAPVRWCRRVMPKGFGLARGVVVNSGNANTCNGARGSGCGGHGGAGGQAAERGGGAGVGVLHGHHRPSAADGEGVRGH